MRRRTARRRTSACTSRAARMPARTAGVGDRALLRIETRARDDEVAQLYRPRHQAARPRQAARARHLPRAAERRRPAGAGRQETARPRACDRRRRDASTRKDGDLVAVELSRRTRASACPPARVKERLGSLKSETAVSLIAIHAHGIPHVFPPAALAEAEAAKPATLDGREDWRDAPARHHRSGRRQGSRRRGPCRARHRSRQSRRLHRHRRDRRRRASTSARLGARPRGARCAATRSISPTASCRCCPSASPTICARCGPARTAPRSRCAW